MTKTAKSSRGNEVATRWRHGVGVLAVLLVGGNCDPVTLGDELPVDPAQPYNGVGMINNGCTAFLIDEDHIVAAAHCFADIAGTGAWQTDLRFYPNFHPDRVAADPARVPRADITRVVVGSRAGEHMLGGAAMDWGIAKLDNWRDTAGLDLTPLTLAPASPTVGANLVNPAYIRHHCPYDDMDSVTWNNMEWDCGQWIRVSHPPPELAVGVTDTTGCNSRWIAGTIHRDCTITDLVDDVVHDDCPGAGGTSGSPIIQTGSGPWTVAGVTHGGSGPDFGVLDAPDCSIPSSTVGASVDRFRDAPRFAANVAVHRRPDNSAATAVFAVDGDRDVVVYRTREGTPARDGRFTWWTSLGAPPGGHDLTRIAACSLGDTSRPQIFVIGDENTLHRRAAGPDGNWGSWATLDLPVGTGQVVDVDATTDAAGRCQLVVATTGAGLQTSFTRATGAWSGWTQVATGSYDEVSALRYEDTVSVTMIDTSGAAWRTRFIDGVWVSPDALGAPAGVTGWQDLDMTWDEQGRGFVLATPGGPGNILWIMPMYGDAAWTWRTFDTGLWAPGASPQDAPELLSLTASRWMEDPAGTTSPVVFGTDVDGNVYFIEYARDSSVVDWVLEWKSFYHERIVY